MDPCEQWHSGKIVEKWDHKNFHLRYKSDNENRNIWAENISRSATEHSRGE